MKISILHPSRGRCEKALSTYESWFKNANDYVHEIEWILSLDEDDNSPYNAYFDTSPIKLIRNKNRSAVDAINNAAKISTGDILWVVSDDTGCGYMYWNTHLLHHLSDRKDFIIKTQDGIQPWIITMPVMDRTYYERFGYVYHPDYLHMFCDTEISCVADLTGRKILSNDLFPHNHYSVLHEFPDEINKRADATWAQGEKLFLERYKRNFDLPSDQIKGKIQDNGMINWLQRKAR